MKHARGLFCLETLFDPMATETSIAAAPAPGTTAPKKKKRILFLDWTRGLAALIMLQGHTFHALMQPELKADSGLYRYSQFFGGEAAAIFLFLTGITYGLGMHKRRDLPAGQRVISALKRARYLFVLAILFRLQMWAFALPWSHFEDLLKVDVLNLMGVGAALLSIVALAPNGMRRARWALLAGVVIAAVAPLMTDLGRSGLLTGWPAAITGYLVPGDSFSIFPWGSFLAFGLAAGNLIPLVEHESWNRIMQWAAIVGFGLIYGGIYFSDLDIQVYSHSDFWLDGPGLIACKMGVALLVAAVAFLWTEYLSTGWSFVRLLGTTSLAVYWVHIELVYGVWFGFYRQILTPWECILAAVVLIAMMVGMSWAIHNLPWRAWLTSAAASIRTGLHRTPVMGDVLGRIFPGVQPVEVQPAFAYVEAEQEPRASTDSGYASGD